MFSRALPRTIAAALLVFGSTHPAHAAGALFPNASITIGNAPAAVAV